MARSPAGTAQRFQPSEAERLLAQLDSPPVGDADTGVPVRGEMGDAVQDGRRLFLYADDDEDPVAGHWYKTRRWGGLGRGWIETAYWAHWRNGTPVGFDPVRWELATGL